MCYGSTTLYLSRPIAGHANLCPSSISLKAQELEILLSTVKHEMLHALGFSVSLFAFFRCMLITFITFISEIRSKLIYPLFFNYIFLKKILQGQAEVVRAIFATFIAFCCCNLYFLPSFSPTSLSPHSFWVGVG